MQKVLIFTDLHFKNGNETILGINPRLRFEEGLAHALRRYPDAKHLVLMGDLANSGKSSEYAELRGALDGAPIPYTLMCGNHDNRENVLGEFPDTEITPEGHLQRVVDLGDTQLITLDTLDGPPFRNDYHSGYLCAHRLRWLDNALRSATGRVVLFMHHPAWESGLGWMDEIRLRNEQDFFDILDRHSNVAHIFTGHLHRTISGKRGGIVFRPSKARQFKHRYSLKTCISHNLRPSQPPMGWLCSGGISWCIMRIFSWHWTWLKTVGKLCQISAEATTTQSPNWATSTAKQDIPTLQYS